MKRHAVLIANGDFPSHPNLPKLITPRNDLDRLKKVLEHPTRGAFKVTPKLDATTKEILDELTRLLKHGVEREDLVLLYYSGHGLLDDNLRLSLAAHDTDEDSNHLRIPFEDIMRLVQQSVVRRVLLLLDCCYSGAAGREMKGTADVSREILRAGQFKEYTRQSLERAISAEKRESKSEASGVYLMTASSAVEPAWGELAEGVGIFTKHIVSGFDGEAMTKRPGEEQVLGVVTVNSLFRHVLRGVQDSGAPQTPRLFVRDATAEDMVIAPISNLAGEYGEAEFQLWQEVPLLENLVPTYILDTEFRFLHWNAGFQSVVAEPMKLKRGAHVATFLKRLENWEDEVLPKSVKDFPVDAPPEKYPRVHCERMVMRCKRLGLIEFQKVASRLRDNSGNWCVTLNIGYAERPDRLWTQLRNAIERDETWSRYAECYDPIIADFGENKNLVNMVADLVGDSSYCLDVGAGTGSTTLRLLTTLDTRQVHAVDINYHMLKRLHEKLETNPSFMHRTRISHCDCVTALCDVPDETYDASVMMNVLFAMDEPVECLKEIRRVLKYGGVLSLSTSDDQTDIEALFKEIRARLRKTDGKWPASEELFENALARNREMVPLIKRYSEDDVVGFLQQAGFDDIDVKGRRLYVGCVFVATTKKLMKEYVAQPAVGAA